VIPHPFNDHRMIEKSIFNSYVAPSPPEKNTDVSKGGNGVWLL
jgi:hypothetical protein